jgi:hypothetical protein
VKWEKIASVKFQAGASFGLTSGRTRPRFEILAIFLGPKRTLKCGCRKTCLYWPDKLEPADDACIHVRALYGNGTVTENVMVSPSGVRVQFSNPVIVHPCPFGKVYLTPLGKEMFAWRHVAHALE